MRFNPYSALEHQLELIGKAYKNQLSPISLVAATEYASRYFMQEQESKDTLGIAADANISFAPLVAAATPAYISADMVSVITEAMSTLPDTTHILPHDLQTPVQFVWMETPVRLSKDPAIQFTYNVQGFLIVTVPEPLREEWLSYYEENVAPLDQERERGLPQNYPPEILIYTVGYAVDESDPVFAKHLKQPLSDWQFLDILDWQNWLSTDTISDNYSYRRGRDLYEKRVRISGDTSGQLITYSYFDNEVNIQKIEVELDDYLRHADLIAYEARRLAAAVVHFMRQRIVKVARHAYPPSRQQIRAAERAKQPPPLTEYVNVIRLRSVEYTPTSTTHDEGSHRHLTSRHIVRAHWRNQYYPSLGPCEDPASHKPKLIPSYIKGPEGTPVKGGSKLFAIVR